jgi:hypothetical protein
LAIRNSAKIENPNIAPKFETMSKSQCSKFKTNRGRSRGSSVLIIRILKTIFRSEARGRDVVGVAYFGPGAGWRKGQNLAVNEAMDGVVNETKHTCRLLAGNLLKD